MRKQGGNNQHLFLCQMHRVTWPYRMLIGKMFLRPCSSMVNSTISVQFLVMHFLFYIINDMTPSTVINPCGLHMESCWVNSHFPVF